jgi:pyruvate dehydrogenase E1 component alpha subunit
LSVDPRQAVPPFGIGETGTAPGGKPFRQVSGELGAYIDRPVRSVGMAEATAPPTSSPPETSPRDGLSSDRLLDAYRWMVLARVVDERCLSLQRQGRIGFYAPLSGQEAAQVGCAFALRPEDWLFPAYRELAVALVRGASLRSVVDQLIGNSTDLTRGTQMPNHFAFREQHYVSASSPIGTQITQAVGAAMAAQRRHDRVVSVTFFGDGATSSNDFHAGMNFAGVFRAPTIFFCQNNEWAISLPREKQTMSKTLAQKADAYGLPGVVVDGNDVNAVYLAVSEARHRAVSGGGPTLIEAQVYRFGPHSTSDDPRRYRTDAQVASARERDPIAALKTRLVTSRALDDATDQKIWDAAKQVLATTLEAAEKAAPVSPDSLFENVFQTLTPRLHEEQESARAFASGGEKRP